MPKRAYGKITQYRTLQVLKGILQIANLETETPANSQIEFRWSAEDATHPKLVMKATVAELWQVCGKSGKPSLTKAAVREALHALEKHLGILVDNRTNTQGAAAWYFTLTLWSRKTDFNLSKAAQMWGQRLALKGAMATTPRQLRQPSACDKFDSSGLAFAERRAALDDYLRWYRQTYGYIKILPRLMRKPVSLESIYVDVKLLDDRIKQFLSQSTIETCYQKFQSRSLFGDDLPRQDGLVVAQQHPYLMVLGSPGVGKSTFLKKLGLVAANRIEQSKSIQIPILIELKQFAYNDFDLREIIKQLIFLDSQLNINSSEWVDHSLRQGIFVFLLDGLDEVPDSKLSNTIHHIHDAIQKYSQNRFVISCRTAAHHFNFTRFVDVIVAEFNDKQIQAFIKQWFNAEEKQGHFSAEQCWSFLNKRSNSPVKELVRTPLLLTYFCLIFDSSVSLPQSRQQLYSQVLGLFLQEWHQQNNVISPQNKDSFSQLLRFEKALLKEIAYDAFKSNKLFFSKSYLKEKYSTLVQSDGYTKTAAKYESILERFENQQGIITERFHEVYSFSHLTLQEYLTAQFIVENEAAEKTLAQHLDDPRWREVVLLSAELMEEEVVLLIDQIRCSAEAKLLPHPHARSVLAWVETFFESNSAQSVPVETRAGLLAAFSAIAASRASDFDIDTNIGHRIATTLVKACESAVAIAKEGAGLYQAAVTSAVAIAAARAIAADEAHSTKIDRVIRNAQDLIDDASDKSGLIHNYERGQVVKKAAHFAYQIANDCRCASPEISRILPKLAKELSIVLDHMPRGEATADRWQTWAVQLEGIWLQVLKCPKDTLTLSFAEAESFGAYLYLTELLIRCLNLTWHIPENDCEQLKWQLLS